ncbi:MAG: TadE/TadG family type IV pilus assembly protein [Acidimicrobiales bacterium]
MRLAPSQRGSVTVELSCLTVVFVVIVLALSGFGRFAQVRADLDQAARDGARAASLRAAPENASADATKAVDAALAEQGLACASRRLRVDTSELHPGGQVSVSLDCELEMAEITLLRLPGRRTMTAGFVAPIDPLIGE